MEGRIGKFLWRHKYWTVGEKWTEKRKDWRQGAQESLELRDSQLGFGTLISFSLFFALLANASACFTCRHFPPVLATIRKKLHRTFSITRNRKREIIPCFLKSFRRSDEQRAVRFSLQTSGPLGKSLLQLMFFSPAQ